MIASVRAWTHRSSVSLAWVAAVWIVASATARAQPVEAPLAPSEEPPWWEFEVDASVSGPLDRSAICPAGHDCILNAGVGVGIRATYRFADGWAAVGGYHLRMFDGDSVFEVTLVHAAHLGGRYVFDLTSRVQPFIGASAHFIALGGESGAASFGGGLSGVFGTYIEVVEDISLIGSAQVLAMSVAPFTTHDGAARAGPFGVVAILELALGLVVRFGDLVAPVVR